MARSSQRSRGNASAGNRTRVTSMATMYSTTRPLMPYVHTLAMFECLPSRRAGPCNESKSYVIRFVIEEITVRSSFNAAHLSAWSFSLETTQVHIKDNCLQAPLFSAYNSILCVVPLCSYCLEHHLHYKYNRNSLHTNSGSTIHLASTWHRLCIHLEATWHRPGIKLGIKLGIHLASTWPPLAYTCHRLGNQLATSLHLPIKAHKLTMRMSMGAGSWISCAVTLLLQC
jgi:hypothetical protein